MKSALTIKRDYLPALSAELERLSRTSVDVGVPAEKAGRGDGSKKAPINNAALAYIHDNGSPAMNIPARPFMDEGVQDKKEDITTYMAQAGDATLEGGDPTPALHAVGLSAQNGIRARINSNIPPPLRPGTIAARLRKGYTTIRTLVVTGKLRNSISYVINRGKK